MKTAWTFFRYELRRYLPIVGALWVLILLLPWLDRGRVESWLADSDARTAAAVLMLQLVAPLLALGLAWSSWLAEKTAGTARFVYARPLSGDLRFGVRLAAVATSVVVYVVGVLLFLWVTPARVFGAFGEIGTPYAVLSNPWLNLMWDLYLGSWLVLLWFLVAAGMLVSVSVTRHSWAVGLFALGFVGFVGLLHAAWWVSSASGWLAAWNETWIGRSYLLFATLCALAFFLAAWMAVRRAPLGPLPWRRMLGVAAAPLLLAFLGVAPLNLSPLDVGTAEVLEEIPWGENQTLEVLQTPATHRQVVFASLRQGGEEHPIRRPVDLTRYETPSPGFAVFLDASEPDGWFVVDEQGEVHDLEFPPPRDPTQRRTAELEPVGWAVLGDGFAWTEAMGKTLWWVGRDRIVRRASLPGKVTGGLWLDEDQLYLFRPGVYGLMFHTETEEVEPMTFKAAAGRLREARDEYH